MIYLDNSATTRPLDAAVDAAREMLEEAWFNPSALYGEAVRVEKKMDAVRSDLASAVGVTPDRVVFTGCGTEADSLAILGAAERFRGPRRVLLFSGEHPAVLNTAPQLSALSHHVEWIPATDAGVIDLEAFSSLLDERVGLVSCMHVGNETGAVQPIAEISRLIREKSPGALFHVDGVQGFLRLPLSLDAAGVHLYAVSAHKVHGVKGVGALFFGKGVKLSPRLAGGGQERGLRSGTENTAGIAAFGAAARWAALQPDVSGRLLRMKLSLFARLRADIDGLRVNGPAPDSPEAAPHILNVSFPGVGGEVMVHAMEKEGVLSGTGSACSSKKREMSAAFRAMRAPRWASDSAVRFSLGLFNTPGEIEEAAAAAIRCYRRYQGFQRR